MKKTISVLLVTLLVMTFTACQKEKEENTVTAPDAKIEFEADGGKFDIQPPETVKPKDATSAFDFDVEAPKIVAPTPVTIKEAKIDFKVEDFELDFASNVPEAQLKELEGLTVEQKKILIEKKTSFLSAISVALSEYDVNVLIDEKSGELVLDSAILFDTDKWDVSQEGKTFLSKFIKAYASVLCDPNYQGFVDQVLVEGHTDTNGSYEHNKTLSEKRADSVLTFCLSDEAGLEEQDRATLKNLMKSVGCSYDKPIKDASGAVDMAASRRVAFRFLIDIAAFK